MGLVSRLSSFILISEVSSAFGTGVISVGLGSFHGQGEKDGRSDDPNNELILDDRMCKIYSKNLKCQFLYYLFANSHTTTVPVPLISAATKSHFKDKATAALLSRMQLYLLH
jgi:hypothetical protein